MSNLGYQFYNDQGKFQKIISGTQHIAEDSVKDAFEINGTSKIIFDIDYPGLLVGLGYLFPKKNKDNDQYALGFTFDHTSGLPYIPGSSVKGVLRSVFPNSKEDSGRIEFINALLGKEISYEEIKQIEITCFGPRTHESKTKTGIKNQDTFYDSYILQKPEIKYLLDDYITPHGDDPTKNPIPIKMLKIGSGNQLVIQIKFSSNETFITRDERKNLFTNILEFTGLGAKTNVGYGQLTPILEKS